MPKRLFAFLLAVALLAGALSGAGARAQNDPPRQVRVSGGVMQTNRLTSVAPVYPQDAKDQQISGTVVLSAVIGSNGLIQELWVVSGPEILHSASLEAVRQWTYKPYLLNGEPTAVETTIVVNFALAA